MAIVKLHISIYHDIELYEVFYDFFSQVAIIGKEDFFIVYRVHGKDIPKEDEEIVLEIYQFDGIKPFVMEWFTVKHSL